MRLKSLTACILIVYTVFNFNTSYAQCSTGVPKTVSYTEGGAPDKLFNTYNFPKFNPGLGTLTGINIHLTTSGVTLLQIVNGDTFENLFKKIKFYRIDEIEAPGLGAVTVSDTIVNYPDAVVGASDTPSPPFLVNEDNTNEWWGTAKAPNNKNFDISVDPAYFSDYSGSGGVSIDYNIYPTFSAASNSASVSLNYVTLATNLSMSITYTYCNNSVLPIGRLDFFAKAAENDSVQLSWTKEHEDNDVTYGIEVSVNGLDFFPVATMQSRKPASASAIAGYKYEYAIPATANGKLYFRIKQTDGAGRVQYSAIRSITTGSRGASLTFFPNPATDHVTLRFGTPPKNRLRADVINSIGQVVERGTDIPAGTGTAELRFKNRLASGVYFIRTIDAVTGGQQVSKLVIR